MSRRDGLGKIQKSAPKVQNSEIQRAIDKIYTDLNDLFDSVNRPNRTSAVESFKGKTGDIRLYEGAGTDGITGYFLQGRFETGWATVKLSLDEVNITDGDVEISDSQAQSEGPEPFITRYGVTYSNLSGNNAIGSSAGQVADGQHTHAEHWGQSYVDGTHENAIHFPLATGNQEITTLIDGTSLGNSGSLATAARSDHTHRLNTGSDYTWTGDHQIGASYGAQGKTLTIKGPSTGSGLALDVYGDVSIDGDLVVSYGTTQSANVSLETDVFLNTNNYSNSSIVSFDETTRIHGPTLIDAGLKVHPGAFNGDGDAYHYDANDANRPALIVEHDSNVGQLRLKHSTGNEMDFKVDTGGNFTLAPTGRLELWPSGSSYLTEGSVLPKGSGIVDLGSSSRKFRNIHANELTIDNIVAQEIMATIGGAILVAPTNILTRDLASSVSGTVLYMKYNDPNFRNSWAELNSFDQFEAILIADTAPVQQAEGDWLYNISGRNVDGSSNNAWTEGQSIIATGNGQAASGNKGYIELTSTGTVHTSDGPRISVYSRKDDNNQNWNTAVPVVQMGLLKDLADYNASNETHGIVIGNNTSLTTAAGFKGLTADADNGLRLFNTDIEIYNNTAKRVEILDDGRFRLGQSLALNNDGTWSTGGGQGVGLSWDGSALIVNGTVNVTGGLLPDGATTWADFQSTVNTLETTVNNIDTSGMSDYEAAQAIISAANGSVTLDGDMNFDPTGSNTYNEMQHFGGVSNTYKAKDATVKFEGTHSLRLSSRHESNVTNNSAAHVDVFNTLVTGGNNFNYIPVVTGMKVSASVYMRSTYAQTDLFRYGVMIYNAEKTHRAWVAICKSSNNSHVWEFRSGSWSVPSTYPMVPVAGGASVDKTPAFIVPWFGADTWGNAGDTEQGNLVKYGYFDLAQMHLSTALAQPASPSGEAGFFAGSDLFGVHDGSNWRIQLSTNSGDSLMALRDSNGVSQLSWNGSTLSINGAIETTGSSGNATISGNLEVSGYIRSTGSSFLNKGFYYGMSGSDALFSVNSDANIPTTSTKSGISYDGVNDEVQIRGLVDKLYFKELENTNDRRILILAKDASNNQSMRPAFKHVSVAWGTTHLVNISNHYNNVSNSMIYRTINNVGYYQNIAIDAVFNYSIGTYNSATDAYDPRIAFQYCDHTGSWVDWYPANPEAVYSISLGNYYTAEADAWNLTAHEHKTGKGRVQSIRVTFTILSARPIQTGTYGGIVRVVPYERGSRPQDLLSVTAICHVDNTRTGN